MKPTPLNKNQLLDLLRDMITVIDADDSFEGSIEYSATPTPNEFMVVGMYRTGNSMGQGGCRLIGVSQ